MPGVRRAVERDGWVWIFVPSSGPLSRSTLPRMVGPSALALLVEKNLAVSADEEAQLKGWEHVWMTLTVGAPA